MNKKYALIFLFLLTGILGLAQRTVITGVVRDRVTEESLPFVNIVFEGSTTGVASDLEGRYTLETNEPYTRIQFSYIGYTPVIKNLRVGTSQVINVSLYPDTQVLKEILVRSGKKKERYRNRDNPAIELIRNVIKNKKKNRMDHYAYAEYEEYEKLQLSLAGKLKKIKRKKLYEQYRFIFDNADTTRVKGQSLLPVYIQETISENYFRSNPKAHKKIIKAHKKVNYNDYFDTQGLSDFLGSLYQNIDIYDNTILLVAKEFISPIADVSPLFYKFYLTDTLTVENETLYELMFVPRNNTDLLFQGMLYIAAEGDRYAVQRVNMMINKNINLNWVNGLHITQTFERTRDDRYRMAKSLIAIDVSFSLSSKGGGFFGERTVSFKNFVTGRSRSDSFYLDSLENRVIEDSKEGKQFWSTHRHDSLTAAELKTYANMDSLQKMPSFKRTVDLISLLLSGYKGLGLWELGPVGTFVSFNPVEGFRLKVGGRTTYKLHPNLYGNAYVAYGFKDRKWKYSLGGTYSFMGKQPLEFPIRALTLSYQRDTKIPGQELQFIPEDNLFLSFRRGVNDKWTYNSIGKMYYLHEFRNHLSFRVGVKRWVQEPAGSIFFTVQRPEGNTSVPNMKTFEVSAELRWAPKERFFQGKKYRTAISSKYPVITARVIKGIKGVTEGQYNYYNTVLNLYKRFYLSQLGFTEMMIEGGCIFGQVPFPLLTIHPANQSYFYQFKSYNLMNFLEFVSDRYVSVQAVHHFNGFLFNKIPLFKRLKLREILTFKMLYGSIHDQNIPTDANNLFAFPYKASGEKETYSLERQPYMEASVGIDNILKIFRIDVVWRLTYLDNPDVSPWGLRGRFSFKF